MVLADSSSTTTLEQGTLTPYVNLVSTTAMWIPSTRPLPRVYIAQSDEVIRNVISRFRPEAVKQLREYMRPEFLSQGQDDGDVGS